MLVRVHRLHPSPASTYCSAGPAPPCHREHSWAGGLPAEPSPLLLVCSPAVAAWEVWVKLGEKGHPGVVTACGGAATAASVLRVHGLSLRQGHRGLGPCLQQAGRTEVFPMPDFLGIQWGLSPLVPKKQEGNGDVQEKLEEMETRKCWRETGRKRLEVNIFHRTKTEKTLKTNRHLHGEPSTMTTAVSTPTFGSQGPTSS